MPEGVENHFVSENVITQTVVAPTYAPLSFTGFQTSEFLDVLVAASIVGIFGDTEAARHLLALFFRCSTEVAQEICCVPALAAAVLLTAFPDLNPKAGLLKLKIVLQFVGTQNTGNRNAILF